MGRKLYNNVPETGRLRLISGPITSRQIDGETMETVTDFILGGSKITADGDYTREIKRRLLLGRKGMINLDSILKRRDITLPTKVRLVKAMVFPVVMYGFESWTVKKAECQRIDAFELWCWRRLLRVPWTARRSNQSILKEINPDYSLEGLMQKLKLNTLATWSESQLVRKDPDAGKEWGQEEKRVTEDEMVGRQHRLKTPGGSEAQGSLVCCSPCGRKETWRLNKNHKLRELRKVHPTLSLEEPKSPPAPQWQMKRIPFFLNEENWGRKASHEERTCWEWRERGPERQWGESWAPLTVQVSESSHTLIWVLLEFSLLQARESPLFFFFFN